MSFNPIMQKVAVAGATGRLGPTVVQALVDAGFEVLALTRSGKVDNLPAEVRSTQVDYSSQESLISALRGQDCLLSLVPDHESQPPLIDAAIAAGVKRYIPSEFGSDVAGNAKCAELPVFRGKLVTQEHLKRNADKISYTIICNSLFLDWGIAVGFWINLNGVSKIYDGGDARRSGTTLADVGKAVVGVLKHPEETKNRAVYVQSAAVSQSQLLEIAKRVKPGYTPQVQHVNTNELLKESLAQLSQGGEQAGMARVNLIAISVFDEEYGGNWAAQNDNELLGIEELSEADLEQIVAQVAKQ